MKEELGNEICSGVCLKCGLFFCKMETNIGNMTSFRSIIQRISYMKQAGTIVNIYVSTHAVWGGSSSGETEHGHQV